MTLDLVLSPLLRLIGIMPSSISEACCLAIVSFTLYCLVHFIFTICTLLKIKVKFKCKVTQLLRAKLGLSLFELSRDLTFCIGNYSS